MTCDFKDTTPISKEEYKKIVNAAFAKYEEIRDLGRLF